MTQTLENDFWHLEIIPNLGASIKSLEAKIGSGFQAVMRPTPDSALNGTSASPCSSFTLAPFSNRIRGAKFVFEGREYQLQTTASDGSTQHGDVRNRPWQVIRGNHALECYFDSRNVPNFNFPFPIRMKVIYSVIENTLTTHLELENFSNSRMPAGFGLHPYFARKIGAEDLKLEFQAQGIYQTDSSFIPTQGMKAIPENLDFSSARSVGGWHGTATLEYQNVTLKLEASEVFSHLCVFASPDGTLAVEPISHCTDGFNLMAQGVQNTGVRILEPGEILRGWVRLCIQG
jgi:aldose 1-epimerase